MYSMRLLLWALFCLVLCMFIMSICIMDIDYAQGSRTLSSCAEAARFPVVSIRCTGANDVVLYNAEDCLGENPPEDAKCIVKLLSATLPNDLSDFTKTMYSVFKISVFDDWGRTGRVLIDGDKNCPADLQAACDEAQTKEECLCWQGEPVFVLVLCIFVAITSIGLMNLLIGVMITTAIENAKRDDKYHRSKEIAERFILLRRLRGLLEPELEQLYYDPRHEEDRTEFMNRITERHIVQWRRRWPYKYYFDMAKLSMRMSRPSLMRFRERRRPRTLISMTSSRAACGSNGP
jgi:hypothetical protein